MVSDNRIMHDEKAYLHAWICEICCGSNVDKFMFLILCVCVCVCGTRACALKCVCQYVCMCVSCTYYTYRIVHVIKLYLH